MEQQARWLLLVVLLPLVLCNPLNKHVFLIVLQDFTLESCMQEPHFAALTQKGQLLTNYHAVASTVNANYLAMVGGDIFASVLNKNNIPGDLLATLMVNKHLTWKAYLEDYPAGCFTDAGYQRYVRETNPFISFLSVRSTTLCNELQNSNRVPWDLANAQLPYFSMFVPNTLNSGSGGTASARATAGANVASLIDTLLRAPTFVENAVLLLTFARGPTATPTASPLYTLIIDPSNPQLAGTRDGTLYDHYSLLASVEVNFALGSLGRRDASATPIAYLSQGIIVPQTSSGGGGGGGGTSGGNNNGGATSSSTATNGGGGVGGTTSNGGGNNNGGGGSSRSSSSSGGQNNGGGGNGNSGSSGSDGAIGGSGDRSSGAVGEVGSSTGLLHHTSEHQPKPSSLPTGVAVVLAVLACCCVFGLGAYFIHRLTRGSMRGKHGALLAAKGHTDHGGNDAGSKPKTYSLQDDDMCGGDGDGDCGGGDASMDADQMMADDPYGDSESQRGRRTAAAYPRGGDVPMQTIALQSPLSPEEMEELEDVDMTETSSHSPAEREMKRLPSYSQSASVRLLEV